MESLTAQSEKAAAKIDDRLLAAYKRIRRNVHNGLAVVTVKRDACGGCFNRIPPQRQMDIRMNKKIIVCEYCGRILVSNQLDEQEQAVSIRITPILQRYVRKCQPKGLALLLFWEVVRRYVSCEVKRYKRKKWHLVFDYLKKTFYLAFQKLIQILKLYCLLTKYLLEPTLGVRYESEQIERLRIT